MASTEYDNLADSQHTLKFSTDGGATWQKVPVLQESPYPEEEPVLDDITPTDAHRTIKASVDFIEDGTFKGTFIYKEGDAAVTALRQAYKDKKTLDWRLEFEDAPSLNAQFEGFIAKFTPRPEIRKKIRVEFEVSVTSDLRAPTVG